MDKPTYSSSDEYISSFPETTQVKLTELRNLIKNLVPEAKEKISYQMPAFTLNGMLLYFAGYARHIGFYPGAKTIEHFKAELSVYKTLKGTVQFPLNQPLPIELITRMILFRIDENGAKKKS
ncbi:MAG: DUF1801 domain-containing protein [Paludibacter sp.]